MTNYNVARYVIVAFVSRSGDVRRTHFIGAETFDKIWRAAGAKDAYLVLRTNSAWIVTSMSGVRMDDTAHVSMGKHKMFDSEAAAVMCAAMMASQGKETMSVNSMFMQPSPLDNRITWYVRWWMKRNGLTHIYGEGK